jgi:hypothetical protein
MPPCFPVEPGHRRARRPGRRSDGASRGEVERSRTDAEWRRYPSALRRGRATGLLEQGWQVRLRIGHLFGSPEDRRGQRGTERLMTRRIDPEQPRTECGALRNPAIAIEATGIEQVPEHKPPVGPRPSVDRRSLNIIRMDELDLGTRDRLSGEVINNQDGDLDGLRTRPLNHRAPGEDEANGTHNPDQQHFTELVPHWLALTTAG